MVDSIYRIAFNFQVGQSSLVVPLTAEVEFHHSPKYYTVRNFKRSSDNRKSMLPDLIIKKLNGKWVHCDSGKETDLSIEAGRAIDAYKNVRSDQE